jgi:hypothetical protein
MVPIKDGATENYTPNIFRKISKTDSDTNLSLKQKLVMLQFFLVCFSFYFSLKAQGFIFSVINFTAFPL